MEGLTILLNRGYDSCGMATIDEDQNIVVSDRFYELLVYVQKREREQVASAESEWFVVCVCGIYSM